MTGIYKITNPSGSVYIGQSVDIKDRLRKYKRNNCKAQHSLYRSLQKYGYENHLFEIIHELPNDCEISTLNTYEELYISQYKQCGFVMLNIKSGGGGGGKLTDEIKIKIGNKNRGRKQSEEQKRKTSERFKGRSVWNKGKKYKLNLSEEQLKTKRTHLSKRIFKHSEETKRQMSLSRKGKSVGKGRRHSEKHKMNMSIANKGKTLSEATKKKMSDRMLISGPKGEENKSAKLTDRKVSEIKNLLNEGLVSQYRIAKMYGVHKVTIFDIKHGKTWKHI
jgi:group I intron endonuclease